MNAPHIVVIDGMNFLHRARVGKGDQSRLVIRNFLTGLRALIQLLEPSRVFMVMEGEPRERLATFPAYKANRAVDQASEKAAELARFYEQCAIAVDLASRWLPIGIVRHPDYEADDVVNTLIARATTAARFTIVSSDSDFIQLLDRPNVAVYDPITREHRTRWTCDYVMWKALRGDSTDNIPPVLTGSRAKRDSEATRLMTDPEGLAAFFEDVDRVDRFAQNVDLIRLAEVPETELSALESSSPERDWPALWSTLTALGISSVAHEPYWTTRFIATFDPLFGNVRRVVDTTR